MSVKSTDDRHDGRLTLKVALFRLRMARECRLGLLILQLIQYLPVGDVTHLIVLLDERPIPVTDSVLAFRHQRVASVVGLAHIAVDPLPTLLAFAVSVFARRSVLAIRERATHWFRAVLASESGRTVTLAIGLAARRKLMTLKVLQVAIEAGRTAIRPVSVYREWKVDAVGGGVVAMSLASAGNGDGCQSYRRE